MRLKVLLIAVFLLSLLLVSAGPVAAAPSAAGAPTWHWVRWGETVYSIGRHYNVSPSAIIHANELYNPHRIYAGQKLYIPSGPPYYSHYRHSHHYCGSYHTVRYGETMFRIARYYGVNAWSIAASNSIYNLNHIWAGQRLFIPCH